MDNTNEGKKATEKTKEEKDSPKPEKETPTVRPEHKKDPTKEKKPARIVVKTPSNSTPKTQNGNDGEPEVEPLKTSTNRWRPFREKTREVTKSLFVCLFFLVLCCFFLFCFLIFSNC